MIFLPHILVGAAIAAKVQNPPLALLLAFLSHYLLDAIPHSEYKINNIRERKWQNSLPEFLKISLDISFGILLILILGKSSPIVFAASFLAILPDGFTFLSFAFPENRLLKLHQGFHYYKTHFWKKKKIPFWGKISSQLLVIFISLFLLLQ